MSAQGYTGAVNPLIRTCPKCGSTNVRRSKRRGFYERVILSLQGLRAYRCERCDHRFYARKGLMMAQPRESRSRQSRSKGRARYES